MIRTFKDTGIHFTFPTNWKMEREENDDGWTVLVQSPATAFMMVCLREDMPVAEDLVDTTLAAMKDDYPQLESVERSETFAGQPAVGYDMEFFSFDFTNTCWARSFYTPYGTVLVMCQTCDQEDNEAVLRAMCKSMRVDEE
jgi:hypothetical protein